ncbi:sigma-70 family RNA polymerase sigma factor [Mesorhizobium sp. B2-2-4]|uniref:sigma-70 family RNA polymerase sigma factor n=1 Tax=unclassified Mesorhizobium TaxID=325217 RepID=UPI00112627CF|nr:MULTISPECIES: sigma-70 family RNA polymerase sigma factor [unclassified Mesorhizobium]TPM59001.1 sigma-70 family RNA polymerase sigma factor [Mesorhizobium sp. B2-2-4]TPM67486.1 sigma-70 family RNA polymerase sigma factor [Mesorhizobium sp. B2-2-1]
MQHDKNKRPAVFDAAVMAYRPALIKLARKLTNTPDEREELVQDTLAYVFSHWANFRNDPTAPKNGMYNWLTLNMRSIAQGKRNVAANARKNMPRASELAASMVSVAASQENIVYAKQIVRRLSRSREGRMLVRIGGGEMLKDIGKRRGIGAERVRQLTDRARDGLKKVAA